MSGGSTKTTTRQPSECSCSSLSVQSCMSILSSFHLLSPAKLVSKAASNDTYVFHGLYKWYILDDDKTHKQPDFALLNTGRDRSDHDKEVK